LHVCSFDPEPREPEPRRNPGPANKVSQPQDGDSSGAILAALSGAAWDVSSTGDRHESSIGMSSSTGGEGRESPSETYTMPPQIIGPVEYTTLGEIRTASYLSGQDTEGQGLIRRPNLC